VNFKYDDDTLIELGECAIALRVDPRYRMLTQLFEQQIATNVLQSSVKETELREQLYHQLQGARAFHDFVELHAVAFEKLTAPAEEQPAAAAQDDDPGVHDIYEP
jgi:hypothetical protein